MPSSEHESSWKAAVFPGASGAFGLVATVAPFFTDNPAIRYGAPALALGITGLVGGILASETIDAVAKGEKPKVLKSALIGATSGATLGAVLAGTPAPIVPAVYGCFCAGMLLQMSLLGELD